MVFYKHVPRFPLDPYIDCIIYYEGNHQVSSLPKNTMSLVFNLGSHFKFYTGKESRPTEGQRHWVGGIQTSPTILEGAAESKMISVQFKTLGASAFLQQPLHQFTDKLVGLDCVFNSRADETWERLQEAKTVHEKIEATEQFLLEQLSALKQSTTRLLHSADLLLRKKEYLSIDEICRQHRISRKHLNHLFKEHTGVSPKLLSSLHRLQYTLRTISQTKPDKLGQLAYDLEYFDQAHFNKDFKRFTGLKPKDYIRLVEENSSLKVVPHFIPFHSG